MGPETLPSACYIMSDESSIPFYSTSNGYKNNHAIEISENSLVSLLTHAIIFRPTFILFSDLSVFSAVL